MGTINHSFISIYLSNYCKIYFFFLVKYVISNYKFIANSFMINITMKETLKTLASYDWKQALC